MGIFDDDDTWMNPQTSGSWKSPPPKNGTFYSIQRKRRIPVTGNVAFIEQWDVWHEYESKKERDEELAKLREAHPSWRLRARQAMYINGQQMGGGDPFEYRDA